MITPGQYTSKWQNTYDHTLFICVPVRNFYFIDSQIYVYIIEPKLNMPYIYGFSVLWRYSWRSPNGEKCHLIVRYIHTYTYLCHRPESGLLSSPSHIHLFSVLLLKTYNVKDTVLALSFKKSNVNWPTHPSLPEMYITAALIFLIVQ